MPSTLSRLKARLRSRSTEDRLRSSNTHDGEAGNRAIDSITHNPNPLPRTPSPSDPLIVDSSHPNLPPSAVESASTTPTLERAPSKNSAPELTPSQQLWNRAYNAVKQKEPKLIDSYERILSLELRQDNLHSDLSQVSNLVEQVNEAERWQQMRQLVQKRLASLEKEEKMKQVIGTGIRIVLSFKDAMSQALQLVPQAALAWASLSFALQILLNPSTESRSNRDGTAHVLARMGWYSELSALVFDDGGTYATSLAGIQTQLESRVVDLFEQVILFLVKSVCSCFKNRISTVLRDLLKLDDWNGSLKGVEDAEISVRRDYSVLDIQDVRFKLEGIFQSVGSLKRALVHDQTDQTCFQHLRVTDPRDDKTRIENTKGGLLQDSYQWILDHVEFRQWREDQQNRLFWVKGDPGKGKTMLLCGIIDELKKPSAHDGLLSFFFCQATDDRINSATAVLRGLIFLLVDQQPSLISHIRTRYDHAGQSLFEDVNAWVALSEIFLNILRDPGMKNTFLVIDALDECATDRSLLLDLIVKEASVPSSVKWVISSRNWPEIEERLDLTRQKATLCLELNDEAVSKAVSKYIEIKVQALGKTKRYDTKTQDLVQKHLNINADNTFLWVALACSHLARVPRYQALACLKQFPPGLEPFYESMIQHMCSSEEVGLDCLKRVLALVGTVYRPITLLEIKVLIDIPEDFSDDLRSLGEIINRCGSFLTLREHTVYFVHQSAKDFLFRRTPSFIFPSGEAEVHCSIFRKSLESMCRTLRRDIYGLGAPGTPVEEVETPDADPLGAIRYSCVYWVEHLAKWNSDRSVKDDNGLMYIHTIDDFLEKKYLYWLEALSLIHDLSEGTRSVVRLEGLFQV
ncbi:MAG: hypothetical protein Q9191_004658 [Dirinaria sp. TL-2023a]